VPARPRCARHRTDPDPMNTRREFLTHAPIGLAAAVAACRSEERPAAPATGTTPTTAGAPPTFGTAPAVGPAVSPATFAEAEKLSQVTLTGPERDMAAASWPKSLAPLLERRVGPRTVALEAEHVPASHWNPVLAPGDAGPRQDRFVRSSGDPGPLP